MLYKLYVEFDKDFVNVNEDKMIIGIKPRPAKVKANREIIKKLARHFGVSHCLCRLNQERNQDKSLSKHKIKESSFCLNRAVLEMK